MAAGQNNGLVELEKELTCSVSFTRISLRLGQRPMWFGHIFLRRYLETKWLSEVSSASFQTVVIVPDVPLPGVAAWLVC